ncbi:MAG TPA: NUDIX domain-containing protein [Bacteroidia bacterium]|jgi:ADP-ribose pyrophosphatase YjhB (NUDIX family)|nr:NUDIX domain-containing protein [Bacteroidia bacterium]
METMNRRLNVRVYGLCLDPAKGLLVADERIHGRSITKLPGGGLEFGEGTLDCLKREFIEETGQAVEIIRHFYTTDFFVPSAFNPESQIISIYYEVAFVSPPVFEIKQKKFDFEPGIHDTFVFRWVRLSDLSPEEFTFPIDKRVAEILIG